MVGHGSSDGPRVPEFGAIPNLVPSGELFAASSQVAES